MRRLRHNSSPEAEGFAQALAAGQITPAAVERRLRQAKDELDDAVYFKHDPQRIALLEAGVNTLERVLAGAATAPEGPSSRRERLEQEAFGRATAVEHLSRQAAQAERQIENMGRELDESIRMRDPAAEIKRQSQELAARQAEYVAIVADLDAARRGLAEMTETARLELAKQGAPVAAPTPAAPSAELRRAKIRLASLRSELADASTRRDYRLAQTVSRELREAEEDVEALLSRGAIANPRVSRSRTSYLDGVKADLESGRLSARDVLRRLDRYRRILVEAAESDPGAGERIVALKKRVKDLEDATRSRGARG